MARSGALAILVAAVVGGLLLIAGELSTIASVDVPGGSCEVINDTDPELSDRCELSGFERHGGAFIVLGLAAVALGWAAAGGSRVAGGALLAVGVLVVAWILLADLPTARETGSVGATLDDATGVAGTGLWLQLAGGLLVVAASVLSLTTKKAAPAGARPGAGRSSPPPSSA